VKSYCQSWSHFQSGPVDIDIVFLTHLNLDHVDTNMTKDNEVWKQTFPKTQHMVRKSDWEVFSHMINKPASNYLEEQVQPLLSSGNLYLLEGEISLTEWVVTIPTPGHAPGHTSLLIDSDGAKQLLWEMQPIYLHRWSKLHRKRTRPDCIWALSQTRFWRNYKSRIQAILQAYSLEVMQPI